ncbi:MAG TPA: hypothetical protein VJ904_14090, partial [Tichowtungia sp.]|nr:hypothetical protein [Tichowtungia sp.]
RVFGCPSLPAQAFLFRVFRGFCGSSLIRINPCNQRSDVKIQIILCHSANQKPFHKMQSPVKINVLVLP